MHHPTDRITHTTAFVAPVVEHWLERGIAYVMFDTECIHSNDVTESFLSISSFFLGGGGGQRGGADLHGGGQEDGIAMIYCAQSNVKWGGGGHAPQAHPIITPLMHNPFLF